MRGVEAHPEISKAGCKDGCPRKSLHDARIRPRYHQDLAYMGSRLRQAVNCSDLYFDQSQTYMSCMADNESSGDPLGLPEEEPVVTEVMEDSPEAENLDTAPEQESNPAAVLDTPAVTPPMRLGILEEAPAPDPQSEPDGVIAAIPLSPAC